MRPRPLNRLLTLLTPTASGTRRAVTALCLVTNLCFLGTPPSLNAEPAQEKPPVPAGAPAPPYVPGRLPYRLKWGSYTVVADVKRDKDGGYDGKQVRVVDARGRTLQQVGSDRVDAVRLVKPLVAGEEGLLVRLSGGNSGLADFHGFGAGAASRFVVSDALDVAVKDLDGDGTAEVAATYRFSDLDGGARGERATGRAGPVRAAPGAAGRDGAGGGAPGLDAAGPLAGGAGTHAGGEPPADADAADGPGHVAAAAGGRTGEAEGGDGGPVRGPDAPGRAGAGSGPPGAGGALRAAGARPLVPAAPDGPGAAAVFGR